MSSQSAPESSARDPTTPLQVYLLGPPRVEWAGHPLPVPRRQTRALLYRLAAHLEPVPREQLCFLFWPDTPESAARRNLSHLLTHLRRALPAPEVLLTTEDCVALDPQQTWSDVAVFERSCAAFPPTPPSLLPQTLQLYCGPFLAGFSLPSSPEFEAWVIRERQTLERLYLEMLATLIEERTAHGAYEEAIAWAKRYLETDDLAEGVHRRLIQLYADVGDRGAALRQFEQCAAILERELGVRPLPETRAVYRAVLEGRPSAWQSPMAGPAWRTLPGPGVPLVGRDEAMGQLEHAFARAQAGHSSVILISGEAGIGKSRLMQDFATRLQNRALILMGAGHPGAQTLPYHPVAQALRAALRCGEKGTSFHLPFSLSPVWLAEASRLLPELRSIHRDLPSPPHSEPDQARFRLFEALHQIVETLASGSQPLVLCLDDLHWADETTLDWLAYLAHELQSGRLLLLGTYRAEEASAVGALRRALAPKGIFHELELAGLDFEAVLQLLHHLVGPLPGIQALARRLQQATGGNPFFLLETLRALTETRQPGGDLAGLEAIPLPDTVREAVHARLEHLRPVARQVLEAGAILTPPFSFDLVRLTAGRRELETMDCLDELVARHLLVEREHEYRFNHDLARRAVEASLSPVRRQLLHRRAGRALEQLDRHAVAALAHHFDAGGEVKKALHYH
ncbi:MAG: hypothetical protein D6791_06915, partial [Chloroflexi bacterium]